MNKDMDKKLDQLLADMPKPEYDLDAWLEEDETEEFDRLLSNSSSGQCLQALQSRPQRRKLWWAVAASLLLLICIGVTPLREGVLTQELPQQGAVEGVLTQELPQQGSVEGVLTQELPQQGSVEGVLTQELPQQGSVEGVLTQELPSRSRGRKSRNQNSLPDTLGTGIWQRRENVVRAVQILSECEADIRQEEQEIRNHIIEATFRATPQPANVILVSDENGDYEVLETKRIINI